MPALRWPWTRFVRTGPASKEDSETMLWAFPWHVQSTELAYLSRAAIGEVESTQTRKMVRFG